MNLGKWVRQMHRWVSILFAVAVVANIVGFTVGKGQPPPAWVVYSPLPPLFLLMLTGLYMFVAPYAGRLRTAR
ncbi:MAG: hypothetical protein U1D55_09615 [Phycisphaerae bacterium]